MYLQKIATIFNTKTKVDNAVYCVDYLFKKAIGLAIYMTCTFNLYCLLAIYCGPAFVVSVILLRLSPKPPEKLRD